jgi:hypothetical protein
MALCTNLSNGEEYALELGEGDVFAITEGNQGMLEDAEPIVLCQLIIDSLQLLERDGTQFITCE